MIFLIILFLFSNIETSPQVFGKELSNSTNYSDLTVYFIDVGQGDSILIQTPDSEYLLIDTGVRSYSSEVISFLQSKSVNYISAFIATHPHADHIGGAQEIFDNFEILSVYEPGYDYDSATYQRFVDAYENEGCPVYTDCEVDSGDYIDISSYVSFQILHINKDASNTNDASIVIRADYETVSFLFTGDINGDKGDYVESYLVDNWDVDIDILKVSHHGSKHASTNNFLYEATPDVSIISCGEDNPYGHPHFEALQRLSDVGSTVYRTDESGDITIKTDGYMWDVSIEKPGDNPMKPVVNGPKTGSSGINYSFSCSSIDPNQDDLFYYWDWCDGSNSGWIGPYDSGEEIFLNHKWNFNGTYIVKVKAKNTQGFESEWSYFEVSMPKNKIKNSPLSNIFPNFRNLFNDLILKNSREFHYLIIF